MLNKAQTIVTLHLCSQLKPTEIISKVNNSETWKVDGRWMEIIMS